ncbi:tyrosine-type recombinase/integrase [Kitasatospora sp. NPDC088134]|uniref:tyrosine-type recombinase/integrase n=1 Tax=Kitasatospora sp. NPDC088134 TaxID=3364071 RepID=UPI00380979D5
MSYYFVSRDKVRRYLDVVPGTDLRALDVVDRKGALADGTPFFLGPDMRPREPLCSYAFEMQKTLGAGSLEDYTYDLLAVEDYLAALDPPVDLLSATEDDLVGYRDYRTEHQDNPVQPGTWKRNRAAINSFYGWAVDTHLLDRMPYLKRKNGRDALQWDVVVEMPVRHLTYPQWHHLHRVGFGGYLPDGRMDRSFRGQDVLRNMSAAELAVTSGARQREFRALLDIEVGEPRLDRTPAKVKLQAIAKRGRPRDLWIQHEVLRSVDLYRRIERAATITKAAPTLYRNRANLFVVTDVDRRAMKLTGRLHGRTRTFAIAAMKEPLRRITVIEGDRGLEPMALFIGRGGRMLGKSRWQQIFDAASSRAETIKGPVVMPPKVTAHDCRHTFAVYMLQILTEQLVQEYVESAKRAGDAATPTYVFKHISRNPLLTVQRLLGHSSPSTTMKYLYYLEDTNVLVQRALAEWTSADKTYADYATWLSDEAVA